MEGKGRLAMGSFIIYHLRHQLLVRHTFAIREILATCEKHAIANFRFKTMLWTKHHWSRPPLTSCIQYMPINSYISIHMKECINLGCTLCSGIINMKITYTLLMDLSAISTAQPLSSSVLVIIIQAKADPALVSMNCFINASSGFLLPWSNAGSTLPLGYTLPLGSSRIAWCSFNWLLFLCILGFPISSLVRLLTCFTSLFLCPPVSLASEGNLCFLPRSAILNLFPSLCHNDFRGRGCNETQVLSMLYMLYILSECFSNPNST